MPRYFFDIVGKIKAFPDTEGQELPNDAVAHEYAINLISTTMLYDDRDHRDWRGWRIDVLAERQTLVVTVLYPYRGPQGPGRTFGRRIRAPVNLLNLFCVAGWVTLGDPPKQAVAGASLSCIRSVGALTCTANYGAPAAAGILHIEAVSEDQSANRAAREQKWLARCRPTLRQDKYGVTRYHYSGSGCEFGKTED